MSIEVRHLSKRFGDFVALDQVSLEVRPGELMAMLGPSGSGKTTLLRIIAGLEVADPGPVRIWFHGEEVTNRPANERRAGFAFQHYALFGHLTVFENIAFGLRVRPREERPTEDQIRGKVLDLLRLVQLEPLAGRYPSQLSGGQRQRVALARTLAVEPRVLLLDEPFGALDAGVRRELRRWLRRLHEELRVTTLFVTHDQEEALEVADRVVILNEGQIEQIGTPDEVYDEPASPFVLQFLGHVNLFHGRLTGDGLAIGDNGFGSRPGSEAGTRPSTIYFRSHDVKLSTAQAGNPGMVATVRHVNSTGPLVRLELLRREDGLAFEVELPRDQWRELNVQPGFEVFVQLRKVRVFPHATL